MRVQQQQNAAAQAQQQVATMGGGQEGWCGMCHNPLTAHFDVKGRIPVWRGCQAPGVDGKTFLLVPDRRVPRQEEGIPAVAVRRAQTRLLPPDRRGAAPTQRVPVRFRPAAPVRARLVYTLRAPDKNVTVKLSKGRADTYRALKAIRRPASVREVAMVAQHPAETTQQFLYWLWKRRIAVRRREEGLNGQALAV